MTSPGEPLPDDLVRGPVRWTRDQRRLLDDAAFSRPFRGVRSFGPQDPQPLRRVREAAVLLPACAAVGFWGAALVQGFPWSEGEEADGCPLPVLVVVPRHQQIRMRSGLRVIRGLLRPGDVRVVDGLPVTSPARTAFDEMRTARTAAKALARADAALRSGTITRGELVAIAETRPGWRGVVQARVAAPLASPNAESPKESEMRWHWIDHIGVEPWVNATITDLSGTWVARVDLVDAEAGVVGEYDGEHHGRPGQRAEDLDRDRRLEALGLVVVRAAAPALADGGYRLRNALQTGYALAQRRTAPARWIAHPAEHPHPR